jgi:hypothetical protein
VTEVDKLQWGWRRESKSEESIGEGGVKEGVYGVKYQREVQSDEEGTVSPDTGDEDTLLPESDIEAELWKVSRNWLGGGLSSGVLKKSSLEAKGGKRHHLSEQLQKGKGITMANVKPGLY